MNPARTPNELAFAGAVALASQNASPPDPPTSLPAGILDAAKAFIHQNLMNYLPVNGHADTTTYDK